MELNQTPAGYFKSLLILYYAILAGQLMFAFIVLFLLLSGTFQANVEGVTQIFYIIVPIFAIAGLYASQFVFKQKLNQIKGITNLSEKLIEYRSASIVRWVIIEAPSLFSIVISLITGDLIFLGLVVIIVAWFVTIKPGFDRTVVDLGLDLNDKFTLENKDHILP